MAGRIALLVELPDVAASGREVTSAMVGGSAGSGATAVARHEAGLVVELQDLLVADVEHDVREWWANPMNLRVVSALVEARHRPADLGDRAGDGVVAEGEECGAVLLLLWTQSRHAIPLRNVGFWPQVKPGGTGERLKKNDLSWRQIVFLQRHTAGGSLCRMMNRSVVDTRNDTRKIAKAMHWLCNDERFHCGRLNVHKGCIENTTHFLLCKAIVDMVASRLLHEG